MVEVITIAQVNAVQGFVQVPVALTSSAASIAWNAATAQNATHTMTENTTLANPTNLVAGMDYKFTPTQHASVAKTLAYGSAFRPAADLPIISTALGATDEQVWRCTDGATLHCVGNSQNVGV